MTEAELDGIENRLTDALCIADHDLMEDAIRVVLALRHAWWELRERDKHTLVALQSCTSCGKPVVVGSDVCGFCSLAV